MSVSDSGPWAAETRSGVSGVEGLAPLVGHTPLVCIRYRLDGRPRRFFAKYESLNMTGSVKDRMAFWMRGDATVVTLLPDCNKKYLSTDLCRSEEVRADYLSPRVELEGVAGIGCPRAGDPTGAALPH